MKKNTPSELTAIGESPFMKKLAKKYAPTRARLKFVEAAVQIPDYVETAGKTREYFQTQGGKQAGDPQKAIEAMVAAASAAEPPRHLLLGRLALERYRANREPRRDAQFIERPGGRRIR